jgi:hypothetical protein
LIYDEYKNNLFGEFKNCVKINSTFTIQYSHHLKKKVDGLVISLKYKNKKFKTPYKIRGECIIYMDQVVNRIF